MKFGKLPTRDAVRLTLSDYVDKTVILPKLPKTFGHDSDITWGVLANDTLGDCVIAGGAHETMLWNKESNRGVQFDDQAAIANYSAITGYNPSDPSTDQGTDMEVAAKYRRKTGLIDSNGQRHKVFAYLKITPGSVKEHLMAIYLFGAIGIGIEFPKSAMDQFSSGKPWEVVKGSPIEGGHYVPGVAKRGDIICVTWGQEQLMTSAFLRKYNDESIAYVSEEMLIGGRSIEGFNIKQLLADLKTL